MWVDGFLLQLGESLLWMDDGRMRLKGFPLAWLTLKRAYEDSLESATDSYLNVSPAGGSNSQLVDQLPNTTSPYTKQT